MRRKAVTFGLLLSCTCTTQAADPMWMAAVHNDKAKWEIDVDSIKVPIAGTVGFWFRMTVAPAAVEKAQFASSVVHVRAECDGDTMTMTSEIFYDKSGTSTTITKPELVPMPPGSVYSALVSYVCQVAKQGK